MYIVPTYENLKSIPYYQKQQIFMFHAIFPQQLA